MFPYQQEIERIKTQIAAKFQPEDIILFGSCAKRRVTRYSDIDICVVMNTEDKRKTVMDILLEVDSDVDLDIVVVSPAEWQKQKDNPATFTGIIHQTGVSLLG
jgi:predicted nucleotidyltransferase